MSILGKGLNVVESTVVTEKLVILSSFFFCKYVLKNDLLESDKMCLHQVGKGLNEK